jgi:ribosomal RNA-processing protein 9
MPGRGKQGGHGGGHGKQGGRKGKLPAASKRKAERDSSRRAPPKKQKDEDVKDEFFSSDSEGEIDFDRLDEKGETKAKESEENEDSDDEQEETVEEKRLRMAKNVLHNLDMDKPLTDSEGSEPEVDDGDDSISAKLKRQLLQSQNKLNRHAADKLARRVVDASSVRLFKGHHLSATCVCALPDGTVAFTGAKDASIIRWDVETGKRVHTFPRAIKGQKMPGHTKEVLAVACSKDGRFMASGGRDAFVRIWDCRTNAQLVSLGRHMDAVSCLAFQGRGAFLYSGSLDRTVNVWNTENLSFVQTLFGHTDCITGIDALEHHERCVTSGQDKTLRLWKVATESQLMFRGSNVNESVDCVAFLAEGKFLGGSMDGSLSGWRHDKKKAVCLVPSAHGGKWLTSVAGYYNSDVLASGSSDGFVRLWKWADGERDAMTALHAVPVPGYINGLTFANDGKLLLCAVGRENRLGRWSDGKGQHNGLAVINLRGSLQIEADQDSDDESMETAIPAATLAAAKKLQSERASVSKAIKLNAGKYQRQEDSDEVPSEQESDARNSDDDGVDSD